MAVLLVLVEPVCPLYIYYPKVWDSIHRESKPVSLSIYTIPRFGIVYIERANRFN